MCERWHYLRRLKYVYDLSGIVHTDYRIYNTKYADLDPLLTLIQVWISNHTHYKVRDEITYPFINFNGATVEV